jgi:signal transduction histidine kinase
MRLWMKVSLIAMALCILALGICTFAILDRTARDRMDKEIASALNEHYMFCASLMSATESADEPNLTDVTRRSMVKYFFGNYAQFYLSGGDFFSLVQNGGYMYNLSPDDPAANLPASGGNARTYAVKSMGIRSVLIIEGGVKLVESDYTVYFTRDITPVYDEVRSLARSTSLICAAFTLALAAALMALIRLTMRPLRRLSAAAGMIAGGDYSRRAPEGTEDEVGDVSRGFNRMADAVQGRIDELRLTAERQKLFMANLTHELKTPMTSIIGYSETLMKARLSEKQSAKALEHIHNECLRIEKLSQKMMGLLSLDSGKKPELTIITAKDLLRRADDAMRVPLEARRQKLALQCGEFYVRADADLIVSLLTNLVDNASKASLAGAKIMLSAYTRLGGERVMEVADSGRGIPQKDIERVTEPFYRADKSRSRSQGGAGLGLALCKAIAGLHGARLEIESEEGVGTKVRAVFPPEGAADEKKD